MARKTRTNPDLDDATVVVTGPGLEGRAVPNAGCAYGFAQHLAAQSAVDVTYYVRDGETPVGRVERQGDVVLTFALVAS